MNRRQKEVLSVQALDGYAPEIGRWLWALKDTRRRTKRGLEGIDPAAIDWTAGSHDNAIGTLLYHIAAIEMSWLFTDILEREFTPAVAALFPIDVRDEQGRLIPVESVSLEEHLHRLDATRQVFLSSLQGVAVAEFRRRREIQGYDVTPEWVLRHLMQHEAEHRGQIGELRVAAERALGVDAHQFG